MMNRNWVVLGAVLIQLALGAIYAWSVFTPELVEAGWSKANTQWVFSVGLASFALVMIVAGLNLRKWGPQKLTFAGGLLLGAGYFFAGLWGGTNFWPLLILIGLIGGAGIGLAYVVPIAIGIQWFPNKKGLITGISVAGFGFGALLWVKLAGSWGMFIEKFGISYTFMLYGLLFAVMTIIGGLWMKFPPVGWKPKDYDPNKKVEETEQRNQIALKAKQVIRKPQFYLLFLTFAFTTGAGLMTIGLMKLYPMEALKENGISVARASAVAGTAMAVFFSLANGFGRILWGFIGDKIGYKLSLIIMSILQGLMVILFTLMAGSVSLLYLGATLIGFNYGGSFALFPTITAKLFGASTVGQNYPLVFLAYGIGGVFGPLLGGKLGDAGEFPLAFTLLGILVLISALLVYFIKPLQQRA